MSFLSRVCLSVWLVVGVSSSAGVAAGAGVAEELRRLDAVYEGMLPWIASLHDPGSGGFYESRGVREGREERAYGPDIQSTHFAWLILEECGLFASMPEGVREAAIDYFRSRQDAGTGYFADPDYPEMKADERTMGRALIFSRGALARLGATPEHALPGERRAGANEAERGVAAGPPGHLVSVEAFRAWLDARRWEDAWTALDQLASQARLITVQEPGLREALVDEALRNVGERRDAATGLVGGGGLIVRLSGAFKLAMFCDMVGRPLPGADQIWESALDWYRGGATTDKIFLIRNPAELLAYLSRTTGRSLSEEELAMVLAVSRRELERYRQADGGFSSFAGKHYIGPNDLYMRPRRVARAGPQGDLNGTASAWALRRSLHRLAGQRAPVIAAPDDFWRGFGGGGAEAWSRRVAPGRQ